MSDSEWKVGTWRTLLLGRGSRCRKLRFSVMNELLASLRREEVGDTAYGLLCLCCGSVLFRTCGFFSGVFSYTSAHTGLCKSCLLSLLVSRLELHAGGQFKAIHLLWLQPKPFCVRNVESTTLLIPAGLHRPLPTQAGSGGAAAAQPVM